MFWGETLRVGDTWREKMCRFNGKANDKIARCIVIEETYFVCNASKYEYMDRNEINHNNVKSGQFMILLPPRKRININNDNEQMPYLIRCSISFP